MHVITITLRIYAALVSDIVLKTYPWLLFEGEGNEGTNLTSK